MYELENCVFLECGRMVHLSIIEFYFVVLYFRLFKKTVFLTSKYILELSMLKGIMGVGSPSLSEQFLFTPIV